MFYVLLYTLSISGFSNGVRNTAGLKITSILNKDFPVMTWLRVETCWCPLVSHWKHVWCPHLKVLSQIFKRNWSLHNSSYCFLFGRYIMIYIYIYIYIITMIVNGLCPPRNWGIFEHLDAGALEVHQQWFMVLENARLPKNQDWMGCSRSPGRGAFHSHGGSPSSLVGLWWKIHGKFVGVSRHLEMNDLLVDGKSWGFLEMDDFLGYPHFRKPPYR